MHRIYWFLLRLLPGSFRQPFAGIAGEANVDEEMYGVFTEASSAARQQGRMQYIAFCMRETGGLIAESFSHRTFLSRRMLLLPAGALIGFLAALIVTLLLGPETYTSTATLREPMLSFMRPYIAAPKRPSIETLLPSLLSRRNLTNIISNYGLYPEYVKRITLERIIERMRDNIKIEVGRVPGEILIRFCYPNSFVAQKVTQDLAARIIGGRMREDNGALGGRTEFLADQLAHAGKEWDRLYAELRMGATKSPRDPLLHIDADVARAQYESLRRKLAETRTLDNVYKSFLPHLEVVNPASLPHRPDLDYSQIYLAGAAIGAFAGMIFPLLGPFRRRKTAVVSRGLA